MQPIPHVKEPAKYARPQAQKFMAPNRSTETQNWDLNNLERTRNALTEEGGDTQSETNLLVIDEPLEQIPVNSERDKWEELA